MNELRNFEAVLGPGAELQVPEGDRCGSGEGGFDDTIPDDEAAPQRRGGVGARRVRRLEELHEAERERALPGKEPLPHPGEPLGWGVEVERFRMVRSVCRSRGVTVIRRGSLLRRMRFSAFRYSTIRANSRSVAVDSNSRKDCRRAFTVVPLLVLSVPGAFRAGLPSIRNGSWRFLARALPIVRVSLRGAPPRFSDRGPVEAGVVARRKRLSPVP
jgi:hypothetical protein